MKNTLICLPVLLALLAIACKKDNCLQGVVLDSKTSKPVSGAKLTINYDYSELGSLKHQQTTIYSHESGEFSYKAEEKHIQSMSIWEIERAGYSEVFDAEWGTSDCGDVVVQLVPLDGPLRLTIFNETGTHDSIYAEVFSKCRYLYYHYPGIYGTKPYPLSIPKGATHTQTFNTCAGDSSAVFWRFTEDFKAPWVGADSFLVKTGGDTTFFEIKY